MEDVQKAELVFFIINTHNTLKIIKQNPDTGTAGACDLLRRNVYTKGKNLSISNNKINNLPQLIEVAE